MPCQLFSAWPPACCIIETTNDTKNNKQRRANTNGLINGSSLQSRWRLEKTLSKNKKMESSQCQPFVWLPCQSVLAEWQKTKKQGQGCQQFCYFAWQHLCQNPKVRKQRSRGDALLIIFCLTSSVSHHCNQEWHQKQQTKKSQCWWFDWWIISSVKTNRKKPKQGKKGKAANANLSFGCHVDQYQPSDKKQRSKDRDANGSKPTCQKPKIMKQRSRGDALWIVFHSTSSVLCHCNHDQHQKQQTKKSWHQQLDWWIVSSVEMKAWKEFK